MKMNLKSFLRLISAFCLGGVIAVRGEAVASRDSKSFKTNELNVIAAPSWVTESAVDQTVFRIQQKLEWTTRRVDAIFYENAAEFARAHSLGPNAIAVTSTNGSSATIHFGPLVTMSNFAETLGHELVHVIVFQKYKGAIPKWLAEGLANHVGGHSKVDYGWLAKQPPIDDVKNLAHPLSGTPNGILYRYRASQALAEMLDKKCNLEDLLRLSVQRKLEDYLEKICEIRDLNNAFKLWVRSRSAQATVTKREYPVSLR